MGDSGVVEVVLFIVVLMVIAIVLLALLDRLRGKPMPGKTMKSNGGLLTFISLPCLAVGIFQFASEESAQGGILVIVGAVLFIVGRTLTSKGKKLIRDQIIRQQQEAAEMAARLEEMKRDEEREKLAEAIARKMKEEQNQ